MISAIQTYFKQILAAVFLIATMQSIFTQGLIKKVGMLACGLVLMLVMLRPILTFDTENLAKIFAEIEIADADFDAYSRENLQDMAQFITDRTRAYILDKAAEISFTPKKITVNTQVRENYPYPHSVIITGMYTQQQRMELTAWIESNLAIPQARQTWRWE